MVSKLRVNQLEDLAGTSTLSVSDLIGSNTLLSTDTGNETITQALDSRWNITAENATVARDLLSRFSEYLTPEDFGALGNGIADDTSAVQAALNSGEPVFFQDGATYRITDTVTISTPNQYVFGRGLIEFDLPGTEGGRMAIHVLEAATGAKLEGLRVNHNGSTMSDVTANPHPIWASAIAIQADEVEVSYVSVDNGADNGIAVFRLDVNDNFVPGRPRWVSVSNCRGFNNGSSTNMTENGQPRARLGACVDIGTGSNCMVSDCIDLESYTGFILDVGAGAQAVFNNCIAFGTKVDPNFPASNAGLGFYIGGSDSSITNCKAWFSGLDGWWIDAPAKYTNFTGCFAYACNRHGFRIDNELASFNGCIAKANGQNTTNVSAGFFLNSATPQVHLTFSGCISDQTQDYGFVSSGRTDAYPTIMGGYFWGGLGRILDDGVGKIAYQTSREGKFGFFTGDPDADIHIVGATSGTNWGDTDGNGQVFISPDVDQTKRLVLAYDGTNNRGVMQVTHAGVGRLPIEIAPNGGDVYLSQGTWTNSIVMNGNWLWVDAGGKLRINPTKPTSDGNGTVVGTQT